MKEVPLESLPESIEVQEHVLIPMADGTKLSAKIWLPKDARDKPVPAILEYIPYRKRDVMARRDARIHAYFAGHGYAAIRVDTRGSGDSEGVLTDEYLEQELQDGEQILSWIAAQPWCSGKVGIIGISWGGFNGLQLAARRPKELGAVITLCSTDDRYADDVHYMGGCLLGDNQSWAGAMLSINSLPPDPQLVGESWRDMWLERLRGSGWWLQQWMAHQKRDDYWKHGSICEDYSAVEVPVFAVSGWADGYSNSVFRLLERLDVPRKGLIGPWSHKYPQVGMPGPAIGFLKEALGWWDKWLKGKDNPTMDEPILRVWMQEHMPPTSNYPHRPGRWIGEANWPSPRLGKMTFTLGRGGLVREGRAVKRRPLTIQSPLSVGLFAGRWCSFTATPDLPHDQRQEDGGALVFDSIRLKEDTEIMGAIKVNIAVESNQPVSMIAVRLSSVSADDKATRITYGLLNLTHRNSHEHPSPMEPDKTYEVTVTMNEIAQVVPQGCRLRLSVSTSYWPICWPAPRPARLTIYTADSTLEIPTRPPSPDDQKLRTFSPPEMAEAPVQRVLQPRNYDWLVTRDLARDISVLEVVKDEGTVHLEDVNLTMQTKTVERYTYQVEDFASIRGETTHHRTLERDDWRIRTQARTRLAASATEFVMDAQLDAYEDERRVFSHDYHDRVERELL